MRFEARYSRYVVALKVMFDTEALPRLEAFERSADGRVNANDRALATRHGADHLVGVNFFPFNTRNVEVIAQLVDININGNVEGA